MGGWMSVWQQSLHRGMPAKEALAAQVEPSRDSHLDTAVAVGGSESSTQDVAASLRGSTRASSGKPPTDQPTSLRREERCDVPTTQQRVNCKLASKLLP